MYTYRPKRKNYTSQFADPKKKTKLLRILLGLRGLPLSGYKMKAPKSCGHYIYTVGVYYLFFFLFAVELSHFFFTQVLRNLGQT